MDHRTVRLIDAFPVVCRSCGTISVVNTPILSTAIVSCMGCWSLIPSADVASASRQSPEWPWNTGPMRLHWYAGYVSEYPGSDDDIKAFSFDPSRGTAQLHAVTGLVHHFVTCNEIDGDGYLTLRERATEEEQTDRPIPPPSRALLPVSETFHYVVTVPPAGTEAVCQPGLCDGCDPSAPQLLGSSPRFRIQPVGPLKGGGALSSLCDVVRPAVSASRCTLRRQDSSDGAWSAASFHLDRSFVDTFHAGDVLHLARSRRAGLGLSLFRGDDLIAALGAVSAVPLGHLNVVVRRDRLSRDIGYIGEPVAPWLHPIEITTRESPPRKPRGYGIRVWYRAWPPPQDADECVSIFREGTRPETGLFASTHMLATSDALRLEP